MRTRSAHALPVEEALKPKKTAGDSNEVYLRKRGVETGIFEDKEMGMRSFLFRD